MCEESGNYIYVYIKCANKFLPLSSYDRNFSSNSSYFTVYGATRKGNFASVCVI